MAAKKKTKATTKKSAKPKGMKKSRVKAARSVGAPKRTVRRPGARRTGVKTAIKKGPPRAGRRVADFVDDVESLSSVEIEQELKAYESQRPSTERPVTKSEAEKAARRIASLMYEKKAENVVLANLGGLTSVTDYFVIGTATSDMHAKAIADHVEDQLTLEGTKPHHKEGYQSLKWVLLDYVDVIAHVFQRDSRVFYDLENLWGDARFEEVEDRGDR